MRTVVAWQESPPEKEGIRNVCYDICFKPDGTQLVAGVGHLVIVYDAADGDLLHPLKGHKDCVYCVAYAHNGKRFASGGADKTVIIWTSKGEGILKYTHNDSIQALSYNPVTQQLASATASDLGLWSPEAKSVAKHKIASRACSLSWTSDGALLAMGMFDGGVSIRDKAGTEKLRIDTGTSPVWCLSWSPSDHGSLAIGCLDGKLRFFNSDGQQRSKDRELDFDPLSLSFFSNGEYLAVSGTDKAVHLYTRDGTYLTQIATRPSWVWSVKQRPKHNYVALGSEDSSISSHQLIFSTVHGLYADRYAYRDQMTDVIIQHLITEQKVRIKCKDYLKKIAVYKDKLAVQLPSKIVIYELANPTDEYDMHYQSATKIQQKLDCNLLVVTSHHVILCQEKKLQLYSFEGIKEREWMMESVIRYIKVVGGPPRREGVLVGLKSGAVLKIFVDNPFPMQLIKHSSSVRCLDLSASRTKLALVDENAACCVYNLITKEKIFEEKGANSVAWNSSFEDMFCFSGNGQLSIKTGDFPLHQQKLQGFVVGFKGSKVFCLHYVSMQTIDVPQSASMYRYLEKKDWETAYKTACLGVTEADWRNLAGEALQAMQLEVARKSYIRIRDVRHVELVNRTETGRKAGVAEGLLLADIHAYCGRYQEAARLYSQMGAVDKALEMFSDLRQFDEAKKWAEEFSRTRGESAQVQELMNKQAEWSEESKNYDAAAEMYIKAKKFDRAIAILARHNWWDKLIGVARQLERGDTKNLQTCVQHFRKAGEYQYAKETLLKMDDTRALITLYVEENKWDDAFLLLNAHPECRVDVYVPYAKQLLLQDKFDEARSAYVQAGLPQLASKILEQLAANSVAENRFNDAAFYFYTLAIDVLKEIRSPTQALTAADKQKLERFSDLYDKAEVYYAYNLIHTNMLSPFKSTHAMTLFNCARFLLMRMLSRDVPRGVSLVAVVYTLAEHAMSLGAFKLARFAYNKLQTLVLPPAVRSEVDLASVLVRAKPFSDAEELLPVCYRCSTTNPLLNTQGDFCINCGAPFIRSFVTFEHLPLVEFEVEPGVSDDEAVRLLGEDAGVADKDRDSRQRARAGQQGGAANVLLLDEEDYVHQIDDAFTAQQMVPNSAIQVDRAMLRRLKTGEVVVRRWPNPNIPAQFFRMTDTEVPLLVGCCGHFFEQDEYEMYGLEHGHAPFSREALQPEGAAARAGAASPRESTNGNNARVTGGVLGMARVMSKRG